MELVIEQLKLGRRDHAETTLKETELIQSTGPQKLMTWMHDKASHWSDVKDPGSALHQMETNYCLLAGTTLW